MMGGVLGRISEWIQDHILPHPPPALETMRRGPHPSPPSPNPLMIQFFTWESKHPEMSWWKHFETETSTLSDLGITQVWLPPPNKAMVPQGQGYDAYDLWDLGEFNQKGTIATRWGTKDELVAAIRTAQTHGIDVLIDAVLNHKIGADRRETFPAVPVDPDHRLHEVGPVRDIEGWTAFDFPGRNGKYSTMKWTEEHFTGLDWDHRTRTKGVFRIVGGRHNGWSEWVDKELGNYDYLLGVDIDHTHPEVKRDLLSWGTWVLETTGAMGFRLDAIKHMDRRFLLEFIKHARKVPGRKNLFAVAEYWSSDLSLIKPYIRAFEGTLTFFDVPLHYNFHNASKIGSKYDLRRIFDNSVTKYRPGDAVTFVDNHEKQIGQTLESWVGSNFKLQAYALILLRQDGYPCVFYGDLYPNKECYDANVSNGLKILMQVRKKFAYGIQRDYFLEKNCIGFVREGQHELPGTDEETDHEVIRPGGCAVLVSNSNEESVHSIRMNVGKGNAGKRYKTCLNASDVAEIDSSGWGTFSCPAGSLQVWVREEEL
ncbi:alpha amylase [Abortiporus biennis]|nr:alpha amylase [Abortiporus biennis]